MAKHGKRRLNNTITPQEKSEATKIFKSIEGDTVDKQDKEQKIHIKKLDVVFKTQAQEELWNMIENKEITICAGSAGTGKSHISILKALDLLSRFPTKFKRIIITTPAVEADENIGFLPGTVDDKLAPYIYSLKYIFKKILGKAKTDRMFEAGQVQVIAMGFLRGINIDDSILICDEFQNTTPRQAKTLLTRIGENSKFILNGDMSQTDKFKDVKSSGLFFSMDKLKNTPEIGIFEFSDKDIVRNPIITVILKKFNGDVP